MNGGRYDFAADGGMPVAWPGWDLRSPARPERRMIEGLDIFASAWVTAKPTASWRETGSESSRATFSEPGKRPRPLTLWPRSRFWYPAGNPSKVLALAGNYKSHLEDAEPSPHPQPFIKLPSSLLSHGGEIVQPADTDPVHYEAEVVVVIGKRARNVSKDAALDHVLGITCGNDISARTWQKGDVQWWRAKGAGHLQSDRSLHSLGRGLQPTEDGPQAERGSAPASPHLRHDSRDIRNRQLYQQVRDPGARRPHLHRHPRNHQGNAAGGRGHGGNRGESGSLRTGVVAAKP